MQIESRFGGVWASFMDGEHAAGRATEDTAPLAICRAALAAVTPETS